MSAVSPITGSAAWNDLSTRAAVRAYRHRGYLLIASGCLCLGLAWLLDRADLGAPASLLVIVPWIAFPFGLLVVVRALWMVRLLRREPWGVHRIEVAPGPNQTTYFLLGPGEHPLVGSTTKQRAAVLAGLDGREVWAAGLSRRRVLLAAPGPGPLVIAIRPRTHRGREKVRRAIGTSDPVKRAEVHQVIAKNAASEMQFLLVGLPTLVLGLTGLQLLDPDGRSGQAIQWILIGGQFILIIWVVVQIVRARRTARDEKRADTTDG